MAIFPVSPSVGQEETVLGRTFVYDGYGWVAKDKSGHVFEDQSGTTLPTRSVAKAGAGIEFEDDDVGEKTVVRVISALTDHIDEADEERHTSNQIVNTAALPNIGLPANSSQEEINAAIPGIVEIRNVSGGFSLTAADGNKYIRFTWHGDLNVTVPNTLEIGKPVTFWQAGAGRLTLVPDSGVTLNGPNTTYSQNTAMQLMKVADNLFDIIGGV